MHTLCCLLNMVVSNPVHCAYCIVRGGSFSSGFQLEFCIVLVRKIKLRIPWNGGSKISDEKLIARQLVMDYLH